MPTAHHVTGATLGATRDNGRAMSQDNVETVQRAAAAFSEGDIEAVSQFLDPDVVFSEPPEQPGATTFYGLRDVLAGFGRWSETWTSQRSEVERVIDTDDTVVILTRETLVGRDGIQVEQPCGTVFVLRNGKIVSFASYWDQSKALEALGLRE